MKMLARISSRIAALFVIIMLGFSVWILALQPVFEHVHQTTAELGHKRQQRSQLTTNIATLEREIEELSGGELTGVIWRSEQIGELTAQIQASIGDMALTNGLKLRSITPAGNRELPSTDATAMRVEGEATLDQLSNFLQELEFHEPVLMVDRAVLRRLNRPGRNPEQPLIFVQLQVLAPSRIEEVKQ